MKWYKTVLIVVLSVVALLFLVDIGLNFWISRQLPQIINRENDSPYQVTYKDLEISLFSRNLKATEIVLVPKASLDIKAGKPGFYAHVESVEVRQFKLWDIIFNDQIVAQSLFINKPDVTILRKNGKLSDHPENIGKDVVAPFNKIIYVSDVFLNRGNIKITEIKNNRAILNASNLSFEMEGILVDDATLKQKLPFTYKTYLVNCDSIYYRMNDFYHVEADSLRTDNHNLKLSNLKLIPEQNRRAFVNAIPKEKDQFAVSVTDFAVNNLDWGFKNDLFFFHSTSVMLDDVNANIYRAKMPPDDKEPKKMYGTLLREIPFPLKVDTLKIKNSKIVYEEEVTFEHGPGVVSLTNFNATATGISSGFGQKKIPDVRIAISCLFMGTARLTSEWRFNVLNRADAFNIKGRVFNFPAERLAAFTKPYLNVDVKGDFDEVYYNFNGNSMKATGDFAINYDDLKVKIYRKNERKKKNKILSALANLFVKNDTKDKVTNAEIEVKRKADRSFFNFLWLCVAEGLRKILI